MSEYDEYYDTIMFKLGLLSVGVSTIAFALILMALTYYNKGLYTGKLKIADGADKTVMAVTSHYTSDDIIK